jgi:hypothetical protein
MRAVAVRPTTGSTVASTRSLEQDLLREHVAQESDLLTWATSWTPSGTAFMDSILELQVVRERPTTQEPASPAAASILRPTSRPPAVRRMGTVYDQATYRTPSQTMAAPAPPAATAIITELLAETWTDYMEQSKGSLIAVYYRADACQGCEEMGPEFDRLAARFGDVKFAQYDCRSSPKQEATARSLGVVALPTFHIYHSRADGSSSLLAAIKGPNVKSLRNAILNSRDIPLDELEFDAGKSGNGYWP